METTKPYIKQIIVITDGKSNMGINPGQASKIAREKGISVNCIGLSGKGIEGEAEIEIQQIAQNGGGVYEICPLEDLGQSLRVVTHKTILNTVECVINKQLKEIVGVNIEGIQPQVRTKIIKYLDQLENQLPVETVIALDCSGSMINKLERAIENVYRLVEFFKAREGYSKLTILAYPGEGAKDTRMLFSSSDSYQKALEMVKSIKAGGKTPTGPAILEGVSILAGEFEAEEEVVQYLV